MKKYIAQYRIWTGRETKKEQPAAQYKQQWMAQKRFIWDRWKRKFQKLTSEKASKKAKCYLFSTSYSRYVHTR